MIVKPSEQSKQDALEVALYIAQDNKNAAMRFLDNLEKTYSMLAEFPHMGHTPYFDFIEGLQTVPILNFAGYNAFYHIVDNVIYIDRVSHNSRHLPNLFKLLEDQ